jgi:hypothetical protein
MKQCALEKERIAPVGSNRHYHRQDISLLSILVYQMRLQLRLFAFRLGFDCQQDADKPVRAWEGFPERVFG